MKKYTVLISDTVFQDIENLRNRILYGFKSPLTAKRYVKGLIKEIEDLSKHGASVAIYPRKNIQQTYGPGIRRVNYKEVAILYLIEDDYIIVVRVMPAENVSGL